MNVSIPPKIIITSGEPAGIGPDLCIKLSQREINARMLVLGNEELFRQRAKELSLTLDINPVLPLESELENHTPGQLNLFSIPLEKPVVAGSLNKNNASYVIKQLELAIDACVSKKFRAMVTGPVHKGIINQAGMTFTGHTEFLAEKTHTRLPVMMLQTAGLRVALATTHVPLKEVPNKISRELLIDIVTILNQDLEQKYGIENPEILVCGLNPHAGEGGYLGDEELRIIKPAIHVCRDQGINVIGPLSADTIFSSENLESADVFLAMYHDQGLPVIKYKGFGETVNVTLGLPIIRTSVDHGTALNLAGTGKADERSFMEAINVACELQSSNSQSLTS